MADTVTLTCEATTKSGTPCDNRSKLGTDPPRCGRHLATPSLTGKKAKALEAYSLSGNVRMATMIAGVNRRTWYRWTEEEEFADLAGAAKITARDVLHQEAIRRAVEGVSEDVWYHGEIVGQVRRYSDRLLEFLMRGADPDTYRDRHTIDAHVDGQITLSPEKDKRLVERMTANLAADAQARRN